MKTRVDLKAIKRSQSLYFFGLFLFILCSLSGRLSAQDTVAIIYSEANKTYQFAAAEMKSSLSGIGYIVQLEDISDLSEVRAKKRIVLTARGTAETIALLDRPDVSPLPGRSAEGYSIRISEAGNKTDYYIIGSDKSGVLYGSQDFTRMVQTNGLRYSRESDKKPYIASRGIKFNIPLDARTPSYSDNSDAAQSSILDMWDIDFWHEFLDNMARNRFNMLSIWSLAPFPSMVDVPEYPGAGISDVKKTTLPLSEFKTITGTNMSNAKVLANLKTIKVMSLAAKIKFWKEVMQYASERGVGFYLFTWNIFTFGTEKSGYLLTSKPTDLTTKDYFRKATKSLINTYPLLKGIGITAGENLTGSEAEKEAFLYGAYGEGINDALAAEPNRTFQLIHRAHQGKISVIKSAFSGLSSRCKLEFSFKYSQAHLYSSVAPDYIYKANFLNGIGGSNFFLTLRDDDWYYLRGGSDPSFARSLIKNIPNSNLNGFYLGPDGYTWGRDYVSKRPDLPNQLILDKRWYSFRIWGELAYDPNLPDSVFTDILKARFSDVNAQNLYDAWAKASQVVPLVNRLHNIDCQLDYQWYPEACYSNKGFHDINKFIGSGPQSGEGLMSISSYATAVLNDTKMTGTTPMKIAQNLESLGDQALSLVSGISGVDKELNQTISDIRAMAYLGQYYSKKISGATNKCMADQATDSTEKDVYRSAAIADLREAAEYWRSYASQLGSSYDPQWLTRMQQNIDVKAIQAKVDNDILLAGGTINRISVTGVTMNATSMNIALDSSYKLIATVSPANATNREIRWTSDDNKIVTVDSEGLVMGEAAGTAIITATSVDGNKIAVCVITVIEKIGVTGSWASGTAHPRIPGKDRALVVFAFAENGLPLLIGSVTYGGQKMTPVVQKSTGTPTGSYTGAFILNEKGIAAAANGLIKVNWAIGPASGTSIISALYSNIDQARLFKDTASGGNLNAITVSTEALSNEKGDIVLTAATAAYNGASYELENGFLNGVIEQSPSWGDIVAGYKMATGAKETPGASTLVSMRQAIIGFVLNMKGGLPPAPNTPGDVGGILKPGDIKVYPNPLSNGNLIIDFHKFSNTGIIEVFDMSGRLVAQKRFVNEIIFKIDLSQLKAGAYMLSISTDKLKNIRRKIAVN